jgi:Family of unknown function (DUF6998)
MTGTLQRRSTKRLLGEWAAIMRELRRRGDVRSENNPTGDLAEALVAEYFQVDLERNSTTGYDLRLSDGTRIQVKGRRRTSRSKPSHFGQMRNLDKDPFDDLVVVLFDEEFEVESCYRLPIAAVRQLSRYSAHTNAWRLPLIKGSRIEAAGVCQLPLGTR